MSNATDGIYLFLKKYQRPLEKFVFPAALVLYAFVGVRQGVDVTDTTYSLGNYQYLNDVDPMWAIATFLANMTGRLLTRLPFGDTMLGMNLYGTAFVIAPALVSYYLLQAYLPPWMIFVGEWIAISLYFCPRVIFYNTLTYLLFTVGLLFLLRALTAEREKKAPFVAAGFALGLNVLTRFPNALEALAIIVVVYYGILIGRDAFQIAREILLCVAGYFLGFLLPFVAVCLLYGSYAYAEMVGGLFSMTADAADYTATGMLSSVLSAYGRALSHMAIMVPCMLAGVVMFLIAKDRFVKWKRIAYVCGIAILILYYFKSGVFTTNYWYYDAVFQAGMMFAIMAIALFVVDLAGVLHGSRFERLLSLACLVVILIMPFGSNNYTFPVLNNLFVVAPCALGALRRAIRAATRSDLASYHFVWISMAIAMIVVLLAQGTTFRARFAFRDGMDGTPRTVKMTQAAKMNGMITTEENAGRLTALYAFFRDNDLQGKRAVLFGDIPGLSYLMDLEPAIFTTWPDLDSNEVARFDDALGALEEKPLVVVHGDGAGYTLSERKYNILQMYLLQNEYVKIYEADDFVVYEPSEEDAQ